MLTPRPLKRWPMPGSPADYETFAARPALRPATCEEAGCVPYQRGWRTVVRVGSPEEALLRRACMGLEDGQRRHFVETNQPGGMVEFLFEPGQPCLAVSTHKVSAEREGLWLRRDGDWRAHTGRSRRYDRPDQWVDDLHTVTTKREHLKITRG